MLISIKKKSLLKKLNLDDLSENQLNKVWPLIANLYQTKLLDNLLQLLPEEDKKKLLLLLSESDDIKTKNFLNSRVAKFDIKLDEITNKIESEILEDVLSAK